MLTSTLYTAQTDEAFPRVPEEEGTASSLPGFISGSDPAWSREELSIRFGCQERVELEG